MIILLVQAPQTFIDFLKNIFIRAHPSESAISAYKQTLYTSFQLNFTQRRQWANPCALILNIEGAMDHSISVEQNKNIYIVLL